MNEEKIMEDLRIGIAKLNDNYSQKSILSTIDIALFYNLINNYIQSILSVDILTIYDNANVSAEEVTRYLYFRLCENGLLLNFMKKFNLLEKVPNILYEMGNKRILNISSDLIINSNKRPCQMPIPNDENQIKRIFSALRNNYELYEKLYKDKVWLINSNGTDDIIIGQARIKISPYMFFHLMGFDYRNIINPSRYPENADAFSNIFPNPQRVLQILNKFEDKNVYSLIELLLENEQNFLSAVLDGSLTHIVNVDKIEMKCYSFERMGVIQSATGMIFFDKQKAIDLGYGDSVQHINSDIILLNDFIRKYKLSFGLDFVISPFAKIKGKQISDQQSIFLTKEPNGGLSAGVLDQQKASISSSAVGYRENDFSYDITEVDKNGATIIHPTTEPIEWKTFDQEERKRVAQTIIESVPGVDSRYLNEIVNENGAHQKR